MITSYLLVKTKTNYLQSAVYDAGAWIGNKTGLKGASSLQPSEGPKSLPREALDQTLEGTYTAAKAVGQGITTVGSTVGESASKVAQHDYGDEAKELVDSARQSGANVGYTAVDLYTGTSLVWHAGEAGVGMTKADEKMQKDEAKLEKEEKKQQGKSEKEEEAGMESVTL
jgi:hypothetical protein